MGSATHRQVSPDAARYYVARPNIINLHGVTAAMAVSMLEPLVTLTMWTPPVASGACRDVFSSVVKLEAVPASPERWDDVVVAFGRRGNDPGWCWCQRLLEPPDGPGSPNNREALRAEMSTAVVPPGVLAYADGVPVGWSRVMPRGQVPGVQRNRALRRVLADDPGAWWVVCFAVDPRHRGLGVATTLLGAAVDHARAHGATAVEGHPVDVDSLEADRVGGSALFTGTMRTFLTQGFSEIGRTYPSRPVMRREF